MTTDKALQMEAEQAARLESYEQYGPIMTAGRAQYQNGFYEGYLARAAKEVKRLDNDLLQRIQNLLMSAKVLSKESDTKDRIGAALDLLINLPPQTYPHDKE